MPYSYYLKPNAADIHTTSPYWFAAFVRFAVRDTYSRRDEKLRGDASMLPPNVFPSEPDNVDLTLSTGDPVERGLQEKHPILLADRDILQFSVSSRKSSHVHQLTLSLNNTDTNYVAELASGDWVGFWAFDNREDFLRIREAVRSGKVANGFGDGLQFLGRVDSVRRTKNRTQVGGVQLSYSVTALGFGEFDTQIYYNPYFVAKYGNDALLWMLDWGGAENNLILGTTRGKGLITSQEVMPKICASVWAYPQRPRPSSDRLLRAERR
jgi:hypothetical protein